MSDTNWRDVVSRLRETNPNRKYITTCKLTWNAAALIEAQAAEVERLTKALDAIAGGGKNCISLLSDPPQCARWYLACAALAAGKAEG